MKNPFLKKRIKKESTVEKYLKEQVERFGGQIRKVQFPGHRGAPDRLVMFPNGVLAWVELKSETGKLDIWQEREHERLRSMSQSIYVLRTQAEVDAWIEYWYSISRRADAE